MSVERLRLKYLRLTLSYRKIVKDRLPIVALTYLKWSLLHYSSCQISFWLRNH